MKVLAIIQARMGSSRLPGKILKKVRGKELLLYQIESLKKSNWIDQVVIATTTNEIDDQIVDFCMNNNIDYFRGSEKNVLKRYHDTWKHFGGDIIVRLTSDCPLIDPEVIDETIQLFVQNNFDYVSNTVERTFPRGLDTEVLSANLLEDISELVVDNYDKEHVTSYILKNSGDFKVGGLKNNKDYSKYRWTVDTQEDFLLIKNLLETVIDSNEKWSLLLGINLMQKYPEWHKLNCHIKQK